MEALLPDLERAVQGDRTALKRVVAAHWGAIRRWALLTCGDPVLAEDGAQDALVRLLQNIGRYDTRRPFQPWLRQIVRNACRDAARKRGLVLEPTAASQPASTPSIERDLDVHQAARRVVARFRRLSPRQREIIDLVDLKGHAPSAAASALGITAGALRNQLFQARRRLRGDADDADILPLLREA